MYSALHHSVRLVGFAWSTLVSISTKPSIMFVRLFDDCSVWFICLLAIAFVNACAICMAIVLWGIGFSSAWRRGHA